MDVKLENIEAESKFFRSLTIILFLAAIMFIGNQVVTVVFTYIFLAVVFMVRSPILYNLL